MNTSEMTNEELIESVEEFAKMAHQATPTSALNIIELCTRYDALLRATTWNDSETDEAPCETDIAGFSYPMLARFDIEDNVSFGMVRYSWGMHAKEGWQELQENIYVPTDVKFVWLDPFKIPVPQTEGVEG